MAKLVKFLIINLVIAAIGFSKTATARGGCRFHPSCSQYALEAFRKHNLAMALLLICRRLLRCNPFSQTTYDPVPERGSEGEKARR